MPAIALILGLLLAAAPPPSASVAEQTREIGLYRHGLRSLIDSVAIPAQPLPTRVQREDARELWRSFLDYQLALETIRQRNTGFLEKRGGARESAFRLYHAAWLVQYRAALEFIAKMERHPALHAMLNEREPVIGLPEGSYAAFKFHWLHAARAAEWAAFTALDRTIGGEPLPGAGDDARAILAAGAGSGTVETIRNEARIVRGAAWAPLPKALSAVAGGQASAPPRPSFISKAQIEKVRPIVRPGDVFFERRDWALTNIGLPGFWSHVSLYAGTPAERRAAFGDAFEEALRLANPPRYESLRTGAVVIEAIGAGTGVTYFNRSADADYFAVLRPNLPQKARAEAILRAVRLLGRPYDFDFDFVTDDRIVCSELLYKAYEGAIAFPAAKHAGRTVSSPNDFVKWFDERYAGEPRELEFVAFLDGHAHLQAATEEGVDAFRSSWRRPRWYPFVHKD